MRRLLICAFLLTGLAAAGPGVTGHWKMDGAATDSSGLGRNGTLVGGPTWTAGRIGQAVLLDGVDDSVTVADAPALRLPGNLTIAFWMRKDREAGDWQRLVGKGDAVQRNYGIWEWPGTDGRLLFQQYDASGVAVLNLSSASHVALGKWTHVAAVVSGTRAYLYINGVLNASATRTGTPATSAAPLTFGAASFHAHFPGALDDVRIYGRALASAEIQTLSGSIGSAPPFSFGTDRRGYLVGEAPVYSISGAPANSPILWSSTKNGASTGETDVDYGHRTDAGGAWTGVAAPWTAANTGTWTKRARIGGKQATVYFVVAAKFTADVPSAASQAIGVAHVGEDLIEGHQLVRALGADTIGLWLGPAYATDYPGTFFPGPIRNLTELVSSAPYQQVLSAPYKTIVLTAFTFANWGWINTHPHPHGGINAGAEIAEMKDLVRYLLRTYQGTGKTFILKNWEGDWLMNETFDLNYVPTAGQVQDMIDFFQARHQGVVDGRAAETVAGVSVKDAVELNMIVKPQKATPCLLKSVIPHVASDFIAYSSWDTIGVVPTDALRRRVQEDVAFLRGYPGVGSRPILITEYGCSDSDFADSGARTRTMTQALLDAGVPTTLHWEILDAKWGLVNVDAGRTRRPSWFALSGLLAPPQPVGLSLAANKTTYAVGESPVYVVAGAAANQPVFWTAWLNGVPVIAEYANGTTDAAGNATIAGGAWAANHRGAWTVWVRVATQSSNAIVLVVN